MSDEWTRDFIACISAREVDRMARFFEEDAVLVSPDWEFGKVRGSVAKVPAADPGRLGGARLGSPRGRSDAGERPGGPEIVKRS